MSISLEREHLGGVPRTPARRLGSPPMSVLGDRRFTARAGLALVLANIRYWPILAPAASRQLERYRERARTIPDPTLGALALEKLSDQGFHAQVAATLATLAPSAHRRQALQAIVAIEVIYDYLDALTEQPVADPLTDGLRLSRAFADALALGRKPAGDYYALHPQSEDGGYLEMLVAEARSALEQLPAMGAIAEVAECCAARFAEAQVRAHAVSALGSAQLQEWAAREAAGTGLGWFEYFAAATSSVLGLHALIAAAADPRTTREDSERIDAVYLYIGVIVTMLDSLIDYERDMKLTGQEGYTRYYADREDLRQGLSNAAHQAVTLARATPTGPHHVMTLAGVVAFYTSAPTATSELARPVTEHIQRALRPLITPTLAVLRTWRLAKRIRSRWEGRPPAGGDELA